MAITESMHPILQEIERAYSEAHRRVRNVEFWEEEHWGIIDDAFMSANSRIVALEAQVAALRMKVEGQDLLLRAYRLGTRPPEKAFTLLKRAEEALATAGPGGGVVGESDG